MNKTIGVDVGGTKISAGLVENGTLVKKQTDATPQNGNTKEVVEAIVQAIRRVWQEDVSGIGVGVPGLVDTRLGLVHDVQNIPSFNSVPLKTELQGYFDKHVAINNDANCFALGTSNFGAGKKFDNLVGLTLGTGLGGGIVLNGKLHEGVGCGAGEFGYVPYRDGILEYYCSGQFFQRQYNMRGEEVSALAMKGDEQGIKIFSEFGFHLGEAIKIIAHVYAPEAVMLGGSIAQNYALFEKSMWQNMGLFPYSHVVDNLQVLPATNPDIALIGAASLVIDY